MIYTLIISLFIEKRFYLLRPQSLSFQIVSEFIDIFVDFCNFYVPGVGLLTPCFLSRGGVLYTMIVLGGRFLPPSSRSREFVPGGDGFG